MPQNPRTVKTRFAPSPTGPLHIGGARTALYSYLWAKKNKGEFLLRIEDTDRARYQPEAESTITKGLEWLSLQWDGPTVKQSERLNRYKKIAEELVLQQKAYYCFCTEERLELMRTVQRKKGRAPKYDRECLRLGESIIAKKLNDGEPHVLRLRIPGDEQIKFVDLIRGQIAFNSSELDDQILLKSDGFPTYHLANVVDDHDSNITHVIRGEEWIPSTPKHVLLYAALGWEPPQFAHLSLFVNKGGGKLSKREGAQSILDYKRLGYLPEAVVNFIAFLGWNPKTEKEFFTLEELVEHFDLRDVNIANPIFDTTKLDWYNGHYIRKLPLESLVDLCTPYLPKAEPAYLKNIVALERERLKKIADITEAADYFFVERVPLELALLRWKTNTNEITKEHLKRLVSFLQSLDSWSKDSLENALLAWIQKEGLSNGDILWPMRVALTGKRASPSPFEVAAVLGKEKTLSRIQDAVNVL